MISHLLKIIWNQRRSNALILLELFLVFVLLWVCNYQLYVYAKRMIEPVGFDYQHVYKVNIQQIPATHHTWQEGRNEVEDLFTLADRIRIWPGVEAVSVSSGSMPFASYSSYLTVRKDTTESILAKCWEITPEFVDVFRLTTEGGAGDLKQSLTEGQVCITSDVYESLALSAGDNSFYLNRDRSRTYQATHVVRPIKETVYRMSTPFVIHPLSRAETIRKGSLSDQELLVRITPEADKNFLQRVKELGKGQMAEGNLYIVNFIPVFEFKKEFYTSWDDEDTFYQMLFILVFFMINIFLGVIGTFWIRTEGRKNEMGLRVALGSTQAGLQKFMIFEGLILFALVWIPAILVCLNLGYMDVTGSLLNLKFTFERCVASVLITTFIMVGMILLGIIYPARQVAELEPAEALRSE